MTTSSSDEEITRTMLEQADFVKQRIEKEKFLQVWQHLLEIIKIAI